MKTILSYPLTLVFYLCFGSLLVFFHPLQWIAHNLFGYKAHKNTVDLLNFFIFRCLNLLGTRTRFKHLKALPENHSIIFVANHQSTFDIPPLIWHLRKCHAKFVSKIELGKGIPSVSFNLRHGGSILINRKKPNEAIDKLEAFGKRLAEKKHSVIIFPEGTRSKNGQMRKFHRSGLLSLLKTMPNAYIVPISINNSWKFSAQNYFPMPIGNDLIFTFHEPFYINQNKKEEMIDTLESIIKKGLIF